jgi:hypothetical protein
MKGVVLLEMLVEPGKALSQPWMMTVGSGILEEQNKKKRFCFLSYMTTETQNVIF